MSEANSMDARLEPMDGSVGQANRYAYSSAIVAELRARAVKMKARADFGLSNSGYRSHPTQIVHLETLSESARQFLEWLDDLSGCDAASTDEARKPNA